MLVKVGCHLGFVQRSVPDVRAFDLDEIHSPAFQVYDRQIGNVAQIVAKPQRVGVDEDSRGSRVVTSTEHIVATTLGFVQPVEFGSEDALGFWLGNPAGRD